MRRKIALSEIATSALVAHFETLGLEQEVAMLCFENARYNKLYDRMRAISDELRRRDGDDRHALLELLNHESAHLRYVVAVRCDDIARGRTRPVLRSIVDSRVTPYSLNAGMDLRMMELEDRGETL